MNTDTATVVAADGGILPALLTKRLIRQYYLPAAKRTLDRWISSGQFPKPDVAIGGKARYWRRETVEAWIAEQSERGTM